MHVWCISINQSFIHSFIHDYDDVAPTQFRLGEINVSNTGDLIGLFGPGAAPKRLSITVGGRSCWTKGCYAGQSQFTLGRPRRKASLRSSSVLPSGVASHCSYGKAKDEASLRCFVSPTAILYNNAKTDSVPNVCWEHFRGLLFAAPCRH